MTKEKPVAKKRLKVQPVIEPTEVGKVKATEVEDFNNVVEGLPEGTVEYLEETYSVRLDAKRLDNRTEEQVQAILLGAIGSVKKITIEKE